MIIIQNEYQPLPKVFRFSSFHIYVPELVHSFSLFPPVFYPLKNRIPWLVEVSFCEPARWPFIGRWIILFVSHVFLQVAAHFGCAMSVLLFVGLGQENMICALIRGFYFFSCAYVESSDITRRSTFFSETLLQLSKPVYFDTFFNQNSLRFRTVLSMHQLLLYSRLRSNLCFGVSVYNSIIVTSLSSCYKNNFKEDYNCYRLTHQRSRQGAEFKLAQASLYYRHSGPGLAKAASMTVAITAVVSRYLRSGLCFPAAWFLCLPMWLIT